MRNKGIEQEYQQQGGQQKAFGVVIFTGANPSDGYPGKQCNQYDGRHHLLHCRQMNSERLGTNEVSHSESLFGIVQGKEQSCNNELSVVMDR